MRLIDADDLIKQIEDFNCKDCNNYNFVRCRACKIDDAVTYIDEAPTVGEWISVEDKLPGIDEDVLILYESKVSPRKTGYAITCLKDSFYFGSTPIPYSKPQWSEPWQYFRENNVITHWMPLPEPPEGVKRDE